MILILDIEYIIPRLLNTGLLNLSSMTSETRPKTGKIITYTSGCPKNQKICWYIRTSPPPKTSKKHELKLRSMSTIDTPAARTGSIRMSSTDVNRMDQANRLVDLSVQPLITPTKMVTIMLTEFNRLESPNM